jgi:hypothetical protein
MKTIELHSFMFFYFTAYKNSTHLRHSLRHFSKADWGTGHQRMPFAF